MHCPICGKSRSARGKVFTDESLDQHIYDAHTNPSPATPRLSLTNEIGADWPDGAYFALAHELGEF